jgi:hypothetical protein
MSGEMQPHFPFGLYGVAVGSALCGLATGFGATTVMAGSEEVAPVSVFDIAVPLRPHSNAIDEMTARGSDTFIAIHPDFRSSKTLFRDV